MASELSMAVSSELATVTEDDIKTVRDSIFKGATDSELKLYLHDCARQGVHPLDRLIYPMVRTAKDGTRTYTAVTGIDQFRTRAEDSGAYAGNDDAVFTGEPKSAEFCASVTVWKLVGGVRCPFGATARWPEYVPAAGKDYKWQQSPHIMLGKCAEALALRKAFPRSLAKVYTQDEMEHVQDDNGGPAAIPPKMTPLTVPAPAPAKRGPGRPPGSKNRPKEENGGPKPIAQVIAVPPLPPGPDEEEDISSTKEPQDEQPLSRPAGVDPGAVLVELRDIKEATGNGPEGPWRRRGLVFDHEGKEIVVGTSDERMGVDALTAIEEGLPVWITWRDNGKKKELTFLAIGKF